MIKEKSIGYCYFCLLNNLLFNVSLDVIQLLGEVWDLMAFFFSFAPAVKHGAFGLCMISIFALYFESCGWLCARIKSLSVKKYLFVGVQSL